MNIRTLYLYLFSFIGLLITVFGLIQLVDLGITALAFDDADLYDFRPVRPLEDSDDRTAEEQAAYEEEQLEYNRREQIRSRQRQLSTAISMIVVGLPLYLYHWGIITKEKE